MPVRSGGYLSSLRGEGTDGNDLAFLYWLRKSRFSYLFINRIAMTATMKYINSGLIFDFILPPQNITLFRLFSIVS